MKKRLIPFILFAFTVSCEITDIDYDSYTIKNETNKSLTILAFDKFHYSDTVLVEINDTFLIDSIIINPYESYYVEKRKGEDDEPGGYFSSADVDSVIILFDHARRLTYVCNKVISSACYADKNIMNWHEYSESTYKKKRGYDYTYTITNEDYESAEPVE